MALCDHTAFVTTCTDKMCIGPNRILSAQISLRTSFENLFVPVISSKDGDSSYLCSDLERPC